MNLNVKALETMHETCEQVLALEYVQHNEKLSEQYRGLKHNVEGCLEMLSDLNICLESLKANGYSQEWFDIVNEGGRFMAVCPVDLPKFFGGNHAKTEACCEAIMGTLVDWAKKAWKVICEIFQFILKCIKIIMEFWNRELGTGKSGAQQFMDECEKLKKGINDALYGDITVVIHNSEKLKLYMGYMLLYMDRLCKKLHATQLLAHGFRKNVYAGQSIDHPDLETGNTVQDIITVLEGVKNECGLHGDKEEVGFAFTSRGVEFIDPASIETISVVFKGPQDTDVVKNGQNIAAMCNAAPKIKGTLSTFQKEVIAHQRDLEDLQKDMYAQIQQGNAVTGSPEDYTGPIQRTHSLYEFLCRWNQQFIKYSAFLAEDDRVFYDLYKKLSKAGKRGF